MIYMSFERKRATAY